MIVIQANGMVDYTPDLHFAGLDSFTYVICDSTHPVALCDTAVVRITVNNGAGPVAVDDAVMTNTNTPLTIDPLSKDIAGTTPQDPGSLDTKAGNGPKNGMSVILANGMVDYTPDLHFAGLDSFTYVICDSTQPVALCDTAVVRITVNNGAGPVAVDDAVMTNTNTPLTIDPLSNDIAGTTPLDPGSLDTNAGNGPKNGMIVIQVNGMVDYTPDLHFAGLDSFTYVICDSTQPVALCDTAVVRITVNNGAGPVAVDDAVMTNTNTQLTIAPLSNDISGTTPLDQGSLDTIAGHGPKSGMFVFQANGMVD
jgi:ribosomal protein S28E/S33